MIKTTINNTQRAFYAIALLSAYLIIMAIVGLYRAIAMLIYYHL